MRISYWSSDVCSSDLIALLEADVALPVVRDFIENITEKVVGQNVLKSVTPGQQVVKIVTDGLTEMLGSEPSELMIDVTPDRKSAVSGKSVSVRVDLGGRRIIKKKKKRTTQQTV